MKRIAYLILVTTLVAGFVNTRPVAAQGTWTTGIDIENLTGTAGNVTVHYFTSTGADAGSVSSSIDAWGAVNFYLPTQTVPPAGAVYSAIIDSNVRIASTVSLANYTFGGADIYLGTDSPGNPISFPLVYRNHTSGLWNSQLTVQNTSGSAQDVTLNLFTAGSSTAAYTSPATSLPGYASHTFNIVDSTYAAFGPFGSATVTGSAPLAGEATSLRNPGTGAVNVIATTYRAFGSSRAGQDIVAPLVYKNYNSWTTGVNVLNTGSGSTTVGITYTNANPNITGGPWTDSMDLDANAMGTFYTPSNTNLPDGFFGSASLHSSDNNVLVVIASQRYLASGAQGVAYEGSLPTDATACVSLPVVHNRTTWKTGINILNLGSSDSDITINYHSTVSGISGGTKNYVVAANSPYTVYMPSDAATPVGFAGSADIKSTNSQPLLVNVANSYAANGVSSNYVGINYSCP